MKSAGVYDDTTLLVGLDGVVVERVDLDPDGCRVVHLATAADVEAVCPSCRTRSTSPRGWVVTRPPGCGVALPVAAGVAQAAVALAAVALPGGGLWAGLVHRVGAATAAAGAGHRPAADGGRSGGRGRRADDRAGRP